MNHPNMAQRVYTSILREICNEMGRCPECNSSGVCDTMAEFLSAPYLFSISRGELHALIGEKARSPFKLDSD